MFIKQFKHLASATAMALATVLMGAQATAQSAPQTIVVDGVTYQAIDKATGPYALPTATIPNGLTPIAVQPVGTQVDLQAAPYTSHSPQVAQAANPQAAQIIVPLVVTALGIWALNQWFDTDARGYKRGHRPHGVRVVPPPPPPVITAPVYRHRHGH